MRTLLFLSFLLLSVALYKADDQITPNIIIDSLDNPISLNDTFLTLQVSCGPAGSNCNNLVDAALVSTLTQTGPWRNGGSVLGRERYTVLSIDKIEAGYTAGPADNVQITYDEVTKLRFATSPGIGGTLVLLYNGIGHNVLPCVSTITKPCYLNQACCVGPNPAGDFTGSPFANADGSVDLTANGTQLGISLVQNTADHDSPLIIRIFAADGRSIVLTQTFESAFVRRTILFLYKDFVPFSGDSPSLTPADVVTVLSNARAIAFSINGAFALDARMTSIQTVGVQIGKKLDAQYVGQLFKPGSTICWTAFVANNAPASLNPPGSNQENFFVLQDVDFVDYAFWNSALHLDRSSIRITPNRVGLEFNTHENDPSLNGDYLLVTFPFLLPGDNVTIQFCGVVRNDFQSDECINQFCNFAVVNIPILEVEDLFTSTTCIDIKYSPDLNIVSQCPTSVTGTDVPFALFSYSNTGNGPADNTTLTIEITGAEPELLNGLPQNSAFTCVADDVAKVLRCTKFIGKFLPGSSGADKFALNLAALGCNVTSLMVTATLTEHCSNLTVSTCCSVDVPRKVQFQITKTDSSGGKGIQSNQIITYTISYQNIGNFAADGVFLIEEYPVNFATPLTTAINAGWTCDTVAKKCFFHVGTLPPATLKTVQFAIQLDAELPQTVTQVCNTVTITNANDTTASRCIDTESATKCTSVLPGVPDTGIKKQGTIGLLIYRITYFNNGSADAQNAVLRETIPAGTNFDAAESDPRWVCVGGSCTINLGVLPKGARASAIFAVIPVQDFETIVTGCFLNRAQITHVASVADPSPLDNIAALDLGNCNETTGPLKCPLPCKKCDDCTCTPPPCNCPSGECNCPVPICTCPAQDCICPVPRCDCNAVNPCSCPDCECACENPCPKIEECEETSLQCVES